MVDFDPTSLLPQNYFAVPGDIEAIVDFVETNGRVPTSSEVDTLLGAADFDHGTTTDPLPDGYAGRDWNNPNWLKRLVRAAG